MLVAVRTPPYVLSERLTVYDTDAIEKVPARQWHSTLNELFLHSGCLFRRGTTFTRKNRGYGAFVDHAFARDQGLESSLDTLTVIHLFFLLWLNVSGDVS
jgi:hypothetical protein